MNVIKPFHVRFYSDSLGLPRKGVVSYNERYIWLLIEWWKKRFNNNEIILCDRAKGGITAPELYDWFIHDNAYFGKEIDVIILHEGICDCAPRPIPLWLRDIISRLPFQIRNRIIKIIHDNRAKIQKSGFKYYITKPSLFYNTYKRWLEEAGKISARIYVIGIAPTNAVIEKQSPGLTENICKYNSLIEKAVKETNNDNIFYIDAYNILSLSINNIDNNIDNYIVSSDGHHITPLTHTIYFDQVSSIEKTFLVGN